jgi:hypothetical protein
LEAEILILRHQLNIQRRHLPKRLTFSAMDRLIFAGLYRLVPSILNALTIVNRTPLFAGTAPGSDREPAIELDEAHGHGVSASSVENDPGCVETHTSAKCGKDSFPTRA